MVECVDTSSRQMAPCLADPARVVPVPHYYRCPISLDLMLDPVTLCTGQTYDRASIQTWIALGNLTCPVTCLPLRDRSLVPNHMLLRLIRSWCLANPPCGDPNSPPPPVVADPAFVASLASCLLCRRRRRCCFVAMSQIVSLAKECEANRRLMSEPEMMVVPALLHIVLEYNREEDDVDNGSGNKNEDEDDGIEDGADVGGNPSTTTLLGAVAALGGDEHCGNDNNNNDNSNDGDEHDNLNIIEMALHALSLLRIDERNLGLIAQPDNLVTLSTVLCAPRMEMRIGAGSLIEALTSSESTSDHTRSIAGATKGLINGLVSLIESEPHSPRAARIGVRALFATCLSSSNWGRAVAVGAAPALVECLLRIDRSDAERALATLRMLCKTAAGRESIGTHTLAVPVLKKMILKVSDRASENAAATLLAVCTHSERLQEEALREGVFTQILLLLQSECSSQAKKKARCLLKLLRENWLDHPCIRAPGRTDVVPF